LTVLAADSLEKVRIDSAIPTTTPAIVERTDGEYTMPPMKAPTITSIATIGLHYDSLVRPDRPVIIEFYKSYSNARPISVRPNGTHDIRL
jgi:hypothetical protein